MTAVIILIWAIHCNRSAEGVSLITQMLYLVVFCTRYLDWFWTYPLGEANHRSTTLLWWNFFGKLLYVGTSVYTILIMLRRYPRTREREKAWRLGAYCFFGSVISSPFVCLIFRGTEGYTFSEWFIEMLWTLSIILESVCVLPQLLLLRQTTVPTVIDSFYLLALALYRALYILRWIFRYADEGKIDPISVIFGLIQTGLYVDFAWVYYSRQRVKLRAGGIVDSDDLSRGWLVSRIIGRKSLDFDDVEGGAVGNGARARGSRTGAGAGAGNEGERHATAAHRWGARGISVSADDGVAEEGRPLHRGDEDGLAAPEAFEDDDADSDVEERRVDTPDSRAHDHVGDANWGAV
jgi:hypothetical protein